ncbi:hypothetical protein BC826DRAFT_1091605 [Russula brevipes]|nr:hypothetical protein BC826DRAFT_1091605 [Russula brevipes]
MPLHRNRLSPLLKASMHQPYLNKKVVDLSDAELIALWFLGENVAPGVKCIVDKVRAYPYRLGSVTCFMVDCLKRQSVQAPPQDATQPPASPTSPTSPALSEAETLYTELSNDSDARIVVAPDLISKYEMNFWYHGLSGNPPKLMWRSDLETNPFPIPPPGTNFFKIPTKTAHGVFNTPLNDVWDDTVAPRILASMKAHGLKYSALQTARFSTVEDGKDETLGPIVVWIAVRPNTTNAGAVRDATPDILHILAEVQITDVVVEWYEASVVRLPKFGLNHPFNTGLGIPIARQSDDAQGALTLLERILALANKPSTGPTLSTSSFVVIAVSLVPSPRSRTLSPRGSATSSDLPEKFGVVDWAPKISVRVNDRHYTRDIATFAVDGEKLENFERNIIYLGNQYTASQLEDLLWPVAAVCKGRMIPADLPLYIVGKYGNTTKLTLGDGDALAILHSGMPRGMHNHVTCSTPFWWVIKQILVNITYSLD